MQVTRTCVMCSKVLTVSLKTVRGYVCPACYSKHVIAARDGASLLLPMVTK